MAPLNGLKTYEADQSCSSNGSKARMKRRLQSKRGAVGTPLPYPGEILLASAPIAQPECSNSRQQLLHYFAVNIGKPEVPPLKTICQLGVIEAK